MSGRVRFKRLSLLLVLLISILLLQCSKNLTGNKQDAPEEPIPDLASVEKRLVESDNKFGLKLFRELNKEEDSDSNVFISPLSVAMALGMTYNGANGETQQAMQKTLELEGFTLQEVNQCYQHLIESLTQLDPKVEFGIANSIWYRLGLTPRNQFINLCQKYFDALVSGLDFSHPNAADTMNAWVEDNTNGRIKDLVAKPIDPLTVMFLINAIYFKGTWTYEFDETETKDAWFHLPDGSRKRCKMMEQRGLFKYFENETFQAIDLPYGDGDFSVTIFLPWWTDVDSLITEFSQDNLSYWISCFKEDSVDVYLPRFKLEYKKTLNEVLITLGMRIAFTGSADFSNMYESVNVFISKVDHKSFLEVNEEGTEAAAATVVEVALGAHGPTGLVMEIDRPFVFMIRENVSGTILFIGKIVDPGYE